MCLDFGVLLMPLHNDNCVDVMCLFYDWVHLTDIQHVIHAGGYVHDQYFSDVLLVQPLNRD